MFNLLRRRNKKKASAAGATGGQGSGGDRPGSPTSGGPARPMSPRSAARAAATENDAALDTGLEAAELRNLLQSAEVPKDRKAEAQALFLEVVEEESMLAYYLDAVAHGVVPEDSKLAARMRSALAAREAELDAEEADARENHGDVEVMDVLLKRAQLRARGGTQAEALAASDAAASQKGMSSGQRIDAVLRRALLGFFWMDTALIKTSLAEAEKLMDTGGDWDRRNRLKVYRGMFAMASRDFARASEDFLSAVATFTSSELCTYEVFVFYAVLTSIVSLGRVAFKKQVIDAPEVRAVVRDVEHLQELMQSLHDCDYKGFFTAVLRMHPRIAADRYLAAHKDWFYRELRVRAYTQFLESYKSVTMDSMAKSFGVSAGFLDAELSRFISSGRLNAKIDKVGGVLESSRPNETNARYQAVIKQGDVLLNRVQLLSRAINV